MTTTSNVAIIGTAGRDRRPEYTQTLWRRMLADAQNRFTPDKKYRLVSGGAAWADHIAVELFLDCPDVFELSLYLPAPLKSNGVFEGERASCGSVSNWYHELFTEKTGIDARKRILEAQIEGAFITQEPVAPGMAAFFVRNAKVAASVGACLAYTWGEGMEPADGGTKHTWGLVNGRRVHVPLSRLCGKVQAT